MTASQISDPSSLLLSLIAGIFPNNHPPTEECQRGSLVNNNFPYTHETLNIKIRQHCCVLFLFFVLFPLSAAASYFNLGSAVYSVNLAHAL